MERGYHITKTSDLVSIMKEGLVPQIGDRSELAKEQEPMVYMFKSLDDAIDGVCNWLGDEMGDEELSLLEVSLCGVSYTSIVEWEMMSRNVISPKNLKVIDIGL